MNFCFNWTDQDVRNFMAANPGVHPYILPKRNLKGQYVHCPNFNLMHCIEDREFNNLHRMVTVIYAGKQDKLHPGCLSHVFQIIKAYQGSETLGESPSIDPTCVMSTHEDVSVQTTSIVSSRIRDRGFLSVSDWID